MAAAHASPTRHSGTELMNRKSTDLTIFKSKGASTLMNYNIYTETKF